jgi:hypothetical protein
MHGACCVVHTHVDTAGHTQTTGILVRAW